MKLSTALIVGAVTAGAIAATPGYATIIYDNPSDLQGGNCRYNSACGPQNGFPNDYAAQLFTLSGAAIVNRIDFNSIVFGPPYFFGPPYGTSANWIFLHDNGPNGLPGTEIASGSDPLSHTPGPIIPVFGIPTTVYSMDIGTVTLGPGSYYVAIHELTSNPDDFLSEGIATSGAAESLDGGSTWIGPGYGSLASIAVTLEDVPEPASILLLAVGLTALSLIRRRA